MSVVVDDCNHWETCEFLTTAGDLDVVRGDTEDVSMSVKFVALFIGDNGKLVLIFATFADILCTMFHFQFQFSTNLNLTKKGVAHTRFQSQLHDIRNRA